MGVQVDGPNALSVDDNLASPLGRLREGGARKAASDSGKRGQRAGSTAEYFSTIRHHLRFLDQTIFRSFPSRHRTGAVASVSGRLRSCRRFSAKIPYRCDYRDHPPR